MHVYDTHAKATYNAVSIYSCMAGGPLPTPAPSTTLTELAALSCPFITRTTRADPSCCAAMRMLGSIAACRVRGPTESIMVRRMVVPP